MAAVVLLHVCQLPQGNIDQYHQRSAGTDYSAVKKQIFQRQIVSNKTERMGTVEHTNCKYFHLKPGRRSICITHHRDRQKHSNYPSRNWGVVLPRHVGGVGRHCKLFMGLRWITLPICVCQFVLSTSSLIHSFTHPLPET